MRTLAILIALFFLGCVHSDAAFVTAGQLLKVCKSYTLGEGYNNTDERICTGYVMGVHDTAKTYEHLYKVSALYCEPPRVTSDKMVLAVKRYLLKNPEALQSPASPKVIDAFIEAFPCE